MIQWPSLPYDQWYNTLDTLHLWVQIVGKVKLKLCPFLNQYWQVALYLNSTGLTTGRIPYENLAFEIEFNFISHTLMLNTSLGEKKTMSLHPQSVADFYHQLMQLLNSLNIYVFITPTPSEISHPIPFKEDVQHASYEPKFVATWHQIQLQSSFIFDRFRSPFRGKSSPVQFFWGSFDLNTTRFSGKQLPDKTDWPKGYSFMRYAENEENFAVGFWPGDPRFPNPAFYSYLVPAPPGCETINTGPAISYFNKTLSECILPYEQVRLTKHPEIEILDFLNTTYKEYAKLAKWNVDELTGIIPHRTTVEPINGEK